MKSIFNSHTRAHIGKRRHEISFQISNSCPATHNNKPQQQEILESMFVLYKTSESPAMK